MGFSSILKRIIYFSIWIFPNFMKIIRQPQFFNTLCKLIILISNISIIQLFKSKNLILSFLNIEFPHTKYISFPLKFLTNILSILSWRGRRWQDIHLIVLTNVYSGHVPFEGLPLVNYSPIT